MNLNLDYYFNNYDDNDVFKSLLKIDADILRLHDSAKAFLEENVTAKNLKVNKRNFNFGQCNIYRQLFH